MLGIKGLLEEPFFVCAPGIDTRLVNPVAYSYL